MRSVSPQRRQIIADTGGLYQVGRTRKSAGVLEWERAIESPAIRGSQDYLVPVMSMMSLGLHLVLGSAKALKPVGSYGLEHVRRIWSGGASTEGTLWKAVVEVLLRERPPNPRGTDRRVFRWLGKIHRAGSWVLPRWTQPERRHGVSTLSATCFLPAGPYALTAMVYWSLQGAADAGRLLRCKCGELFLSDRRSGVWCDPGCPARHPGRPPEIPAAIKSDNRAFQNRISHLGRENRRRLTETQVARLRAALRDNVQAVREGRLMPGRFKRVWAARLETGESAARSAARLPSGAPVMGWGGL